MNVVLNKVMFVGFAMGLALPASAQKVGTQSPEDYRYAASQDARRAWIGYLETGSLGPAKNNLTIQYLWRNYVGPALAGEPPEIPARDPGYEILKSSWIANLLSNWAETYVGKESLDLTVAENWWYAFERYESKLFELPGIDPVAETIHLLPREVVRTIREETSSENLKRIAEIVTTNFERIGLTTEILCQYASSDEPFLDVFSRALFDLVSSGRHLAGEALSALSKLAREGLVDAAKVETKIGELALEESPDPSLRGLARVLQATADPPAGGAFYRLVSAVQKRGSEFFRGGGRSISTRSSGRDLRDVAGGAARGGGSRGFK